MRTRNNSRRPGRLHLEMLEARENPAGTVTANVSSSGVLTIKGDDNNNIINIALSGTDATISGDLADTFHNVKSINVIAKGGNDTVTIAAGADFELENGGATFDLGDGDNTLTMQTTERINIGSLTVKGGDGLDTINLNGNGAGPSQSQIRGGVNMALGIGGSNVTVQNIAINGAAGINMTANEGTDTLNLTKMKLTAGGVKLNGGAGQLNVNLALGDGNSVAGAVNASAKGAVAVSIDSGAAGEVSTIGSLAVQAGPLSDAPVIVRGQGTAKVTGALSIRGLLPSLRVSPTVADATTLEAGSVSIFAKRQSLLQALFNGTLTVTGNVYESTGNTSQIYIDHGCRATVGGNLTVNGGYGWDQVIAPDSNLFVTKNVLLNLKGGANVVDLEGANTVVPATPVSVGGNLTIDSTSGTDIVQLFTVTVGGNLNVNLGSGADVLTMEYGTKVTGTTSVNLGAGDDVLQVANTNSIADDSVTLTGKAVLRTGAGNDLASLGNSGSTDGKLILGVEAANANLLDMGGGYDTYLGTHNVSPEAALKVLNVDAP